VNLSIAITNFNTKLALERCLRSVIKNTEKLDKEIIVVDNGSEDGSADMVREKFPSITLIPNPNNKFYSKAFNQAFNRASGDYFLVLNSDIEIQDGILADMMDMMQADNSLGILGCHSFSPDGKLQHNCSNGYPLKLAFFNFTFSGKVFPWSSKSLNDTIFLRQWDRLESRDVAVIPGSLMMVRKNTVEKLGGLFDENLVLFFSDNDLCDRIRQAGMRVRYLAEGHVIHAESLSLKKTDISLIGRIYRNDIYRYFSKSNGILAALVLRIAIELTRAVMHLMQALNLRKCKPNLVWGIGEWKK